MLMEQGNSNYQRSCSFKGRFQCECQRITLAFVGRQAARVHLWFVACHIAEIGRWKATPWVCLLFNAKGCSQQLFRDRNPICHCPRRALYGHDHS